MPSLTPYDELYIINLDFFKWNYHVRCDNWSDVLKYFGILNGFWHGKRRKIEEIVGKFVKIAKNERRKQIFRIPNI